MAKCEIETRVNINEIRTLHTLKCTWTKKHRHGPKDGYETQEKCGIYFYMHFFFFGVSYMLFQENTELRESFLMPWKTKLGSANNFTILSFLYLEDWNQTKPNRALSPFRIEIYEEETLLLGRRERRKTADDQRRAVWV